jgi:hypothetical protein
MNINLQPDTTLMILIGAVLEFFKIYLPDNIEPKALPILAVLLGGALGFVFKQDIVCGVISGLTAAGLYKIAMKTANKIGGNDK